MFRKTEAEPGNARPATEGQAAASVDTPAEPRRRPRLGTAVRGMPTGLAARAGELCLAGAGLALGLVLCAMPWLWLGLGLGLFSATAGFTTYRRRDWAGTVRLFGAAATAVALLAVALAGVRVALSFAATLRLEQMLR
jgi:hypothetical protein